MDGRRFWKLLLTGCLAAGAVGCNRNAVRSPSADATGAMPVTGVPTTPAKKPFWGSPNPDPTLPVTVEAQETPKGPPRPESLVAFADCKLESAFGEQTPAASRQQLLDDARELYQQALQQAPENKAALLGLARYYTRVGDREKAVEKYKKYLTLNPDDKDVAHDVALAHAQWKDWDGAVAWCKFALNIDPESLAIRKTMAFCLARAGKWEEGYEAMRQVMPEAQARYLMARVLEHQNHLSASRQQLVLALQASPTFAPAQEFLVELDRVLTGAAPDTGIQQAGHTQE